MIKMRLEEAMKTENLSIYEKHHGDSEAIRKAQESAYKSHHGFYVVGKRYTNGVDTIEVKTVDERPEIIHFSVIDGETEIINYNWLDEMTGEEHPDGEPFDAHLFSLVEWGFTQEV